MFFHSQLIDICHCSFVMPVGFVPRNGVISLLYSSVDKQMSILCAQASVLVLVFACVITNVCYVFRHVSRSAVHSLSTYFNKAARLEEP